VRWLTGADAQSIAKSVNYASLPQQAAEKAEALLRGITYDGKPLGE